MNIGKYTGVPIRRPLTLAICAMFGMAASLPVLAESEIESLRRELAEQKEIIRQILASQQAQKEASAKVEAKIDAQGKAGAEAQTSAVANAAALTPYGVLDGGFERITNVKNSGGGTSSLTRMPSITGSVPSRVGLRGMKEFAPGYKAIATAEIGFNLDDGTLGQSTTAGSTNSGSTSGARIFGRQLFAGVDTPYGAFTIGRQYSMLMYALGDADVLGPNIYSMGPLDAYLPNARFDNSVAWKSSFSNVTLGMTFSTGRDTSGGAPASGTCAGEIAGQASLCRGWSALAKYDDARFGVAAGVDEQRGGTGATASFFNGATALAFTRPQDFDRRTTLNANLKVGAGKIGIGWLGREVNAAAGTVRSNMWFTGLTYRLNGKITLDGSVYRITNHDQQRNATLLALRGFYAFDKDFDGYVQVGHIANSSNASYAVSVGAGITPPAGGSQTGTMVGLRYKF